jgi:hypothetical protein
MQSKDQQAIKNMKDLRQWVQDCLGSCENPTSSFWFGYQHMKLREAIDSILESMACSSAMREDLPKSDKHQGTSLRLAVDNDLRDTVLPHPGMIRVNLPMLLTADCHENHMP